MINFPKKITVTHVLLFIIIFLLLRNKQESYLSWNPKNWFKKRPSKEEGDVVKEIVKKMKITTDDGEEGAMKGGEVGCCKKNCRLCGI